MLNLRNWIIITIILLLGAIFVAVGLTLIATRQAFAYDQAETDPEYKLPNLQVGIALRTKSGKVIWIQTYLREKDGWWSTEDSSINILEPNTGAQLNCQIVKCIFLTGTIDPLAAQSLNYGGWYGDKLWTGDRIW